MQEMLKNVSEGVFDLNEIGNRVNLYAGFASSGIMGSGMTIKILPVNVLSLNKEEKKLVKLMLNRCKNLYADIWKQPDLWKKAMRYIGFDKKTPERVRGAFENLAHNRKLSETGRPLLTPVKQMQIAISAVRKNDLNPALTFAKNFSPPSA